MTEKQRKILQWTIEDEGLDYALRWKSSWREIKDIEFHSLLDEYKRIARQIEAYINEPDKYDFIKNLNK
jgi:hypothetical protein